jgi:hypothetical protein
MIARGLHRYAAWCRARGGQLGCHPGLVIAGALAVVIAVYHFRRAVELAVTDVLLAAVALAALAIAVVTAVGAARAVVAYRSWRERRAALPARWEPGPASEPGAAAWPLPAAARELGVPPWPQPPATYWRDAPAPWPQAPAAPDNAAPSGELDPVLAALEPDR